MKEIAGLECENRHKFLVARSLARRTYLRCPSETQSVLARLSVNVYFLTFWVDNFPNILPKMCTRSLNFNYSEKAKTP